MNKYLILTLITTYSSFLFAQVNDIENVHFNVEEQSISVKGNGFNNFIAFTDFTREECYEDARLKIALDETPQISSLNVNIRNTDGLTHDQYLDRDNMQVDFPLSSVVNGRVKLGYISYQLASHIEISSEICQESYRLDLDMAMKSNKYNIWHLEMVLLKK